MCTTCAQSQQASMRAHGSVICCCNCLLSPDASDVESQTATVEELLDTVGTDETTHTNTTPTDSTATTTDSDSTTALPTPPHTTPTTADTTAASSNTGSTSGSSVQPPLPPAAADAQLPEVKRSDEKPSKQQQNEQRRQRQALDRARSIVETFEGMSSTCTASALSLLVSLCCDYCWYYQGYCCCGNCSHIAHRVCLRTRAHRVSCA
jgi:hypothetical protein